MEIMKPKRAVWWAAGLSFLVYLLPLMLPHVMRVWGWALVGELRGLAGGRRALWLAADLLCD